MKKIEVDENDIRKIILMLKLSKQYLHLPTDNLRLLNAWRVSGKLADKLMKKAKLTLITDKGKTIIKNE